MKKFLVILLSILALPMLSLSFVSHQDYQYFPKTADSGFDGGYGGGDYGGGGSWGGGSSWDDDDDDYYYSGSSSGVSLDSEDVPMFLAIVVLIISLVFTIRYISYRFERYRGITKQIEKYLDNYHYLKHGDGSNDELVQSAYANYVEIQKAWMNRDLTPVKHLLTDEIYNMYQMQIETLLEDNQVNVMSNFEFYCGKVSYKRAKNNLQTIKIILCVNCKDYIIDANTNHVINGDKRATITYIYELTFVRDLNSNKTMSNCPTCGAKVKKQMSATCPYCNNALLLSSQEITMSNKTVLQQFKRK